jgi:hypothetical protein
MTEMNDDAMGRDQALRTGPSHLRVGSHKWEVEPRSVLRNLIWSDQILL